jgi:hypothetical protein
MVNPGSGVLLGKIITRGDTFYNVEPVAGTGTWFLTGWDHVYSLDSC